MLEIGKVFSITSHLVTMVLYLSADKLPFGTQVKINTEHLHYKCYGVGYKSHYNASNTCSLYLL